MYNPQLILNRIDALLTLRGTTKVRLNEHCGISRNTLSQSKDRPNGLSAKILFDAADFLGCTVDYLLGRSDDPKPAPSNLTREEVALIEMYRELSPKEQGKIYGKVETLCEMRQAENKKDGA